MTFYPKLINFFQNFDYKGSLYGKLWGWRKPLRPPSPNWAHVCLCFANVVTCCIKRPMLRRILNLNLLFTVFLLRASERVRENRKKLKFEKI
jgi:hypothetical protein